MALVNWVTMLGVSLHSNNVSGPFTPPLIILTPCTSILSPPRSSKADLVSVEGKAWCLVSFELSYVNACSHIYLAVLDISTRKWNESVTNVLASVELFSEQRLCQLLQCVCVPRNPLGWWLPELPDGGANSFSLWLKKKKRTKEMSYRVA